MNTINKLIETLNELIRLNDAVNERWESAIDKTIENVDVGIIHHMERVMDTTTFVLDMYSTSIDPISLMNQEILKLTQIIEYFDTNYPYLPTAPLEDHQN